MAHQDASTMDSKSQKSLVHKRAAIKRILNNIKSQLNKVASTNQLLERLKACHDEFFDIQVQLDTINDSEDDQEWDTFLDTYNSLLNEIESLTINENNKSVNTNRSGIESQLRLPAINLPTFSGNFDQWFSFYDTFCGLVHNNKDLLPIQKFHFLKSTLLGEAANAISGLDITENNYREAWELLKERYHNIRIIIQKHVRALFDLPTYTKDLPSFLLDIYDKVNKHLRALKSLEQPTDKWDSLITYLISSKLDHNTAKEWELSLSANQLPTIKDILNFINKKAVSLQMINKSQTNFKPQRVNYQQKISHAATFNINKCILCTDEHFLYYCKKFLNETIEARRNIVKENHLCFNCLKQGHRSNDCKSSKCRKCQQNHNTLLHKEIKTTNNDNKDKQREASTSCMVANASSYVLLATAQVNVKDNSGSFKTCTALLDSGSQTSLITKVLAEKLNLPQKNTSISLSGITGNIECVNRAININISSAYKYFKTDLECLVVEKITQKLPLVPLDRNVLNIPKHVKLADQYFHEPKDIDILIGADLFWKIIQNGRIERNQIILTETKLGWIIAENVTNLDRSNRVCNHSITNFNLEKFWKLEDFETKGKILTINEKRIEENFDKTFKRNMDGRFVVKFPLKNDTIKLGTSYNNARNRFFNLEAKLYKDQKLFEEYDNFMKEYCQLGHMKEIKDINYIKENPHFYLPHHAVIKNESLTTKLRVVFDGSATTTNGMSLNDNLEKGPTLQDELFNILLRFRTKKYVISADITKMYRQVLIDESQRKLQRILWRNDKKEPIKTYELQTVTYGTASAAYLAIRCMHQLAKENENNLQLGASTILTDFYVDDLLTGAHTIAEATQIKNEIITILKQGGFEIRKWCSNEQKIIGDIKEDDAFAVISFDKSEAMKTLGLQWNCRKDVLFFNTPDQPKATKTTKRLILSHGSKIFDPLGLIGPITIQSKLIMQELWKINIGWDADVPETIHATWDRFITNWEALKDVEVSRLTGIINENSELHGFCDASTKAYGACLYLRTKNKHGEYTVKLICAKAKVAPIKTQSLPRLELCGALLLARLVKTFLTATQECPGKTVYWTDSKIVLSWIKATNKRWKTFVANRIGEIQETTNIEQWFHVKGIDNPADVISRGIAPKELQTCALWWQGPRWLQERTAYKQEIFNHSNQECVEEEIAISMNITYDQDDLLKRYSNWKKLIRVIAYCTRFWRNLSAKRNGTEMSSSSHVTLSEYKDAKIRIIKMTQQNVFMTEINELKKKGRVSNNSRLINLNPFLDKNEIIRVGGRLINANINYSNKHPIVLPANHHITNILIEEFHQNNLHAGLQATLNAIRQEYWPLHGQSKVKQAIRNCIKCFRYKPRTMSHMMGDLPAARVNKARPFLNCGVDFCGPFFIKIHKKRNAPTIKVYISLFVCLSIKAVHMEIVDDLTTESFLAAYKRFVARRGKPENMYSDNGTRFIAANKELKCLQEVFKAENTHLMNYITSTETNWHFIPPRSPHFGGLWEAAVKSAKTHLKKVTTNAKLRHDEFRTLITQIESMLNSRPLTPMSSDANDLNPLTPFHFLIGANFNDIGESNLETLKLNSLSRWQYVERIKQQFWKR